MKFLKVLKPGFLATVQDRGRYGFGRYGISASGAADQYSLRLGNLLVGNTEGAAAIEMTLVGGEFQSLADGVVAVTGSDFDARLDDEPIPMWTSIAVRRGQRLTFGATRSGARCYLSIAGGVFAPELLGSRSTHLLTGLGGFEGRPLRNGDEIEIGAALFPLDRLRWRTVQRAVILEYHSECRLRVLLGPQDRHFSKRSVEMFLDTSYIVTEKSNRMGLRLDGPALKHKRKADIPSEGVPLGAVQVPQNGLPIILFVEHQTTGGYPKIATVISTDFHRIGQAKPGDKFSFTSVSLAKALKLLRQQERLISPKSIMSQKNS